MLHSTILSHVFLAVFLYICTVAALTDRELEKIINTAVSGEELKDYRRYPDLEDLEDFKTNLDGLENLNEEGPEDFGSVETENVDDGVSEVVLINKRGVDWMKPFRLVNEHSEQNEERNTNSQSRQTLRLMKRGVYQLGETKHSTRTNENGIPNTDIPVQHQSLNTKKGSKVAVQLNGLRTQTRAACNPRGCKNQAKGKIWQKAFSLIKNAMKWNVIKKPRF